MSRIDVVIPTRNRFELTSQAVLSVQAQSVADWTLWVVDDGGDDGSGENLSRMFASDHRINVLFQPSQGPERTRDVGVRAGSARWVALLDSDDVWLPTKLEAQLLAAKDDFDTVLCGHEWFRPDGSTRRTEVPAGRGRVSPLLSNNMSTPLIRRDLLERIGGLGQQPGLGPLPGAEGIEFYVRLLNQAHIAVVPDVLVRCRDHEGVRESSKLASAEGAAALDAVAQYHSSVLEEWPREYSLLLARVATRYLAAGMSDVGIERFCSALRMAPWRSRVGVMRRYGPFVAKATASRWKAGPRQSRFMTRPGA